MSKLSSVLKKTGIAVAAAAMLVTMGAGTVVTQAKTSLPVYKVSLVPAPSSAKGLIWAEG